MVFVGVWEHLESYYFNASDCLLQWIIARTLFDNPNSRIMFDSDFVDIPAMKTRVEIRETNILVRYR